MATTTASNPPQRANVPLWLWLLLFFFVAVAAVGLTGLDLALAKAIVRPSHSLDAVVDSLELITLKSVSEFILPVFLLSCGGALWMSGQRGYGKQLCYVGLVLLIAYLVSDLSKPQFGRLRPFEMLERGLPDVWFAGGNSFPSGHVAFFAGFIMPIVILYPRAWPLLAVPVIVAAQRVLAADHYISDVAISCALALASAALLFPITRIRQT